MTSLVAKEQIPAVAVRSARYLQLVLVVIVTNLAQLASMFHVMEVSVISRTSASQAPCPVMGKGAIGKVLWHIVLCLLATISVATPVTSRSTMESVLTWASAGILTNVLLDLLVATVRVPIPLEVTHVVVIKVTLSTIRSRRPLAWKKTNALRIRAASMPLALIISTLFIALVPTVTMAAVRA